MRSGVGAEARGQRRNKTRSVAVATRDTRAATPMEPVLRHAGTSAHKRW